MFTSHLHSSFGSYLLPTVPWTWVFFFSFQRKLSKRPGIKAITFHNQEHRCTRFDSRCSVPSDPPLLPAPLRGHHQDMLHAHIMCTYLAGSSARFGVTQCPPVLAAGTRMAEGQGLVAPTAHMPSPTRPTWTGRLPRKFRSMFSPKR